MNDIDPSKQFDPDARWNTEFFPADLLLAESRKEEITGLLRDTFDLEVGGLAELIIGIQDSTTRGNQYMKMWSQLNLDKQVGYFNHVRDLSWTAEKVRDILTGWEETSPLGSESLSGVEARAKLRTLLSALEEKVKETDD